MSTVRLRAAALMAATTLLASCSVGTAGPGSTGAEPAGADATSETATAEPEVPPVRVSTNLPRGKRPVAVDSVVEVDAADGTLRSVKLTATSGEGTGRVDGALDRDRTGWHSTGRLEPGTSYLATVVARDEEGASERRRIRFRTENLTLDQQTYASIAPLDGETVGVGMPVVVQFDVPVQKRAVFERHMTVTSRPAQPGSWHWVSDREAHWRPKRYWRSGTRVSVDVDVDSVPAGNGVYGQESRQIRFDVGSAIISKVDAASYTMQVFEDGRLLRTIPITTGKAGFTTRSGTKVIMEKHRTKRMRSETTGIGRGDAEYYDIAGVEYAMRLTYSGEFIHAAPWSVGSQGYANVSHGCTGMSTENAGWLYSISKRGDVVEYTGTDRWMDLYNGYGDWNASFSDYKERSALT